MLRVLLALGLWVLGSGFASAQYLGPPNAVICNKTVSFTGTGAAVSLVAPASRTTVLICGWDVTSTAASTFAFTTGTQTTNPCDTNTVAITPTMNVSTNAVVDHQFYATFSSAPGSGLCVNAGTQITGMIYYTTLYTPQ